MPCLSVYAVFLIALLEGAMGETKGLGEKCATGTDTCTSNPESVCDDVVKRCLIKHGQSCAGNALSNLCVSGAECDDSSSMCACKAAVYTADNTTGKCTSSNGKWGLACSSDECTGTGLRCVSNVCVCNEDKSVDLTSGDCTRDITAEQVGKACTDQNKATSCGAAGTNLECPAGGGVCDCIAGYVGPLAGSCSPLPGKIGGGCVADPDCKANNDTCASNVCECASNYSPDGLDTCKLDDNVLGGPCTVQSGAAFTKGSCTDTNAVCTDKTAGTCVCKQGYSGETAGTCAITPNTSGGACTTDVANQKGSCMDNKHVCSAVSDGVCNCKVGYQEETGFGCKLKVEIAGEDCTASGVVCVGNSMCDPTTKQCKCMAGYAKDGDMCGPAANTLGGSCTAGSCTDKNAECTSNTCSCKDNYLPVERTCKLSVGVTGVDCSATDNECVSFSTCGSNKECSCNTNFKETSGVCVPVANQFGGQCSINTTYSTTKGTCSDANAVCDYGFCLCKSGFTGTAGGGCAAGASSVVVSALALLLMPAAYLLSTVY